MRGWLLPLLALVLAGFLTLAPSTARAKDDADHKPGHKDDAHKDGAGEGADHAEHETGLPMKFKMDSALWSLVTFLGFFFVLSKLAWKPLSEGLASREAGIQKNIADAEAARKKSEHMLADYQQKLAKAQDEIKALLDEARRDGETARQNILADAQREATATRQRGLAEIEQAKNQALDALFDAMSDRVVSATEHVIGRSLGEGDHARLVNEALQQVAPKA